MPTATELAVMPVWSLNALAGIFDVDELPLAAAVVVVDDELVEPQATAEVASKSTKPTAARWVFFDVRVMFSPWRLCPRRVFRSPTDVGVLPEGPTLLWVAAQLTIVV